MTYEATTTNSEATQTLAGRLARQLRGGETIELASDLGGGKTTFAQGLVRSLGYGGDVTSPTFTLSQIYKLESGLEIHHYDLYRLQDGGVVGEELEEDMADPTIITIIEWAGVVNDELPVDRLRINIEVTAETERTLRFTSGGAVSDRLLKELVA
jgi:tRNA threonylcarbamoyladenosine biosynthesis protein TsaE